MVRRLALTALAGVAALVLGACVGPVEITDRDLDTDAAQACARFVDDLPDELAEQERGEVEPSDALGAAYGDPAIIVTCGVPEPPEFGPGSSCEIVDGVRWYLPDDQFGDDPADLTLTAAWDRPRVQVTVPADYWPEGGAAVTAALSPLVEEHLERRPGECI